MPDQPNDERLSRAAQLVCVATINAGDTSTFGIFVAASSMVPVDPTNNRIFVRFNDNTATSRGATSIAVRSL